MSVHISDIVGYLDNPLGTFIELKSNDPITPTQHDLNEFLNDFGVIEIYDTLFDVYYVEDSPTSPVTVFAFCIDLIISDLDYMDKISKIGELDLEIARRDSTCQPGSIEESALRMSDMIQMFTQFYISMLYNDGRPDLQLADIILTYPQHIKNRLIPPIDNFGMHEFNIIYDYVNAIEKYVVMAILPFKRQNNAINLQSQIA